MKRLLSKTGGLLVVKTFALALGVFGLFSVAGCGSIGFTTPTPVISPVGGTYTTVQTVTITDAGLGSTIYYTTDGSTPTTNSTLYNGPFFPLLVTQSTTVQAIAVTAANGTSLVARQIYTINLPVAPTPVITPMSGTYGSTQTVTITDTLANSVIYYTTDGSTPAFSALVTPLGTTYVPTGTTAVYSAPLTVSTNTTVQAIAAFLPSGLYSAATGTYYGTSAVASAIYTILTSTPVIAPAGGNFNAAQTVTITDSTPGAVIYYTTNGTTPTTASAVYSGPITVAQSETLEAIAVAPGNGASPVATAVFSIVYPAATPVITPNGGTGFTTSQSVTITDSTPGSTIYYTTNGTTPTTASTVYTGAFTVGQNETIEANATATGFSVSPTATAVFTFNFPTAATPTFSPTPGLYGATQTVTITDTTPAATIYYTVNGGALLSGASPITLTVASSTILTAYAGATNYNPSPTATADYYISASATPIVGTVKSGAVPIYNATVNIYAMGATGYGAGSTLLGTTTTNAAGSFTLIKLVNGAGLTGGTGGYFSCASSDPNPDPQIYITSVGGNTQGTGVTTTNNAAAAFMAVLGPCSTVTAASAPLLNELTTVASVFAISQYINPGSGAGKETVGTNGANTTTNVPQGALGLNNAVAGVVNLASITAGTAVTTKTYTGTAGNLAGVVVTATPEAAKLTTIANALAACINSVSATASPCVDLFASASPPPVSSVTSQPTATFATAQDTLQAAYYMAVNPIDAGTFTSCSVNTGATSKLGCLYSLGTTTTPGVTYAGGLTAIPTDWTLGVTYSSTSNCAAGGAFMNAVYRESVDAYGNIWFMPLNSHTGALSAISPIGAPIYCAKGTIITTQNYTTGFATGLTIDTAGDIWAAWGTNIASTTAGQIYEAVSPGAVPSTANMTLSLYDSAILGSGTYSPTALVGDAYGNVFYSTNSGAQSPATVGTFVYEIPAGTTNTSTAPVSVLVGSDVAATGLYAQGAADSVGRVYFSTNTVSNGLLEVTPPSASITGYSISGGSITVSTSPNTFTVNAKVVLNGLTSADGLLLNNKQLTVTSVPSSTSFTATTSLPATSGTITDPGTVVLVPTTTGAAAYTTVVNNVGAYKVYGASVDNNNYIYTGYDCCAAATPYDTLAKVTVSPSGAAIASQTGNYTWTPQHLGGIVGIRSTALDGADNIWFGNYAPSVDTTAGGAAENDNTGIWSIGELASTGGGSTATFTALSPAPTYTDTTLPNGDTCTSSANPVTGVSGCPVGGGFQKTAFETTEGLAIDPSGNVWVGGFGTPIGQTAGGTPQTSITEIIGAAVPIATPLAVAAKNGTLATKP
jgi:hypothetical protein